MLRKNLDNIVIIIISFIIISLPFLGKSNTVEETTLLDELFFKRTLIASAVTTLFFLINYYFFIPYYYFNRKYFLFALIVLTGLFLVYYIPSIIITNEKIIATIREMYPNRARGFRTRSWMERIFLDRNAYLYYITFIVALVLRTHQHLQEVKNQQLKSELSYLKAQINPHFLFNTLNSIYALALIKSELAPNAILKVSSMMRYVVSESDKEYITIDKEIQYIQDYIELQKLRLNTNTKVEINIQNDAPQFKISPMLLIPFIENAFKYGVHPKQSSSINIDLKINNQSIVFECINDILDIDVSTIEQTGTGIINTQKRLQTIYRDKAILNISESNRIFKVNLFIKK